MGIFRETNTIKWPVKAKVPRGDGSKRVDTETFNVKYKLLTEEERKELKFVDKEAPTEEKADAAKHNLDIIVNAVEGWDLENFEFTPSNIEKLINNTFYLNALVTGFYEAQNGGDLKN